MNRTTERHLGLGLLTLFMASSLPAQQSAPACFILPDQDRVHVVLAAEPRYTHGFTVSRRGAGDAEFVLITPEPVRPVEDPYVAREMLGEAEYEWASRVMKTEDEFALLRKLRNDPGPAAALCLASRPMALVMGRRFEDTLVKSGEEYRYRVAFLDYNDQELLAIEENVRVGPHPGPEMKATDIKASGDNRLVRISWQYPTYLRDRSDIVVGFHIYRREAGATEFARLDGHVFLRSAEQLMFRDTGVENEQSYEYCLTVVDVIGAESPRSQTVAAQPRDTSGLPAPSGVVATPFEGRMEITWQPLQLDSGLVRGYNVYRAPMLLAQYQKLNTQLLPPETDRFVDEDVVTGRLNVYRVGAVDRDGKEGRVSSPVFGQPLDTTPPLPVTGLTAEVESRIVRLAWQAQPGRDLDGFYVYRSVGGVAGLRLTGEPVSNKVTQFVDSGPAGKGLRPGGTYRYSVSQVDLALNEGERTVVEVKIPDDEPPLPPAGFYCTSTDSGQVEVIWQPSLSRDLAGYEVFRSADGKDTGLIHEAGLSARFWQDRTVRRGQTYYYWLGVKDSSGNQARKGPYRITPTDIAAPPPPEGLKAVLQQDRVELSWNPVAEEDIAGYNVYRSDQPSGIPEKLSPKPVAGTRFVDPKGAKENCYWVQALDTSGNESARSVVVRAMP